MQRSTLQPQNSHDACYISLQPNQTIVNSPLSNNRQPTAATPSPASLRISPKRIEVAFLPQLTPPGSLVGRTVIVTDVLRATTTIINALANGCHQVLPQPSLDAARQAHAQTENSVMGGERGGKIVDGFHHGNSPLEYTREIIEGKSLVLATTNGTIAMEHCREAKRVLIGAMTNLGAIADRLPADEPVTIVCSGTDGHITSEDVLFAGALVERLLACAQLSEKAGDNPSLSLQRDVSAGASASQSPDHPITSPPHLPTAQSPLTDHAIIALNHWQHTASAVTAGTPLADFFRNARGGINLVKIGHDPDIVFAAQIDTHSIVPELDVASWSIR
jgi:2-phosphosulfolactate phosphatase